MNFEISVELIENTLNVYVQCQNPNEYTRYAYYLYKEKNVLAKTGYMAENTYSFNIEEDGFYMVKVFVQYRETSLEPAQKTVKNSDKIRYYCKEKRK